ncbi:MAG: hypothetical protein NTZ85_02830 [Bacteroidia bacterium]|nr:hypothetical protein [Bacteroidia bacterium]
MYRTVHKRIIIISLAIIILTTIGGIIGLLFSEHSINEIVAFYSIIVGFSLLAIVTSFAFIHEEKTWIKKTAKYAYISFPVLIIVLIAAFIFDYSVLADIVGLILIIVSTLLTIDIFVYKDAKAFTLLIILVSLDIISLVIKRYPILFIGLIISLCNYLLSAGIFIYGIRCLYLAGKNKYLKYVTFIFSCVVASSCLSLLYKTQHWPGGNILLYTGQISLVLVTLFVLLTLTSSGFIDWQPLHKKILMRLLVPWTLLFFLFILRFLLPEVNRIIWSPDKSVNQYGFYMKDYDPVIKNGLNKK